MAIAAADSAHLESLLDEYESLRTSFLAFGGYEIDHRIEEVLAGLELGDMDLDRPMDSLSGGQKVKIALARLLLASPSVLLLDEPTNNLDLPALLWLEKHLQNYGGAIMVVSHDRKLLDRVVTEIVELDEHRHTTTIYHGNFSDYSRQKGIERRKLENAYKEQQELMLAKMVASGANLLILDEPTNHMDYRSLGVVESALREYTGSILVISHDRYFLEAIAITHLLVLENGMLTSPPGGFEQYERSVSRT